MPGTAWRRARHRGTTTRARCTDEYIGGSGSEITGEELPHDLEGHDGDKPRHLPKDGASVAVGN